MTDTDTVVAGPRAGRRPRAAGRLPGGHPDRGPRVLTYAFTAVPVGRWIDRHGGRTLMIAGSPLGSLAVFAWSRVDTLADLYLVFLLIGLAAAMSLYEPAFAVLVML
jgi:hypothetical protein